MRRGLDQGNNRQTNYGGSGGGGSPATTGRTRANKQHRNRNDQQNQNQAQQRANPRASASVSNFKFIIGRPQAIVIDLLGVLVCKSFMTNSTDFRHFFQQYVLEYLTENWKQKQLKIMVNFFRCSQANVPDEYKLADRDESREDQIKQARKHVIWKFRNDPTNSALSLFMLGITEWGYKNKFLTTPIYDEVPGILRFWKEQAKIPVYVGVGSADFLVMVLTYTSCGNILPFFNGHMNIMDFDGTKANKDFRKLVNILRLPPEKILYLTRFRQDCRKAIECGLQSIIVLRPDFDSHNLIPTLRARRGRTTSLDGTRAIRGPNDDPNSPPGRSLPADLSPEVRLQMGNNISTLSLIEDHEDTGYGVQSSQIVEQDLTRYSVVLALSEIAFK